MAAKKLTALEERHVNPQDPATWLIPGQPLIGADGRDWSWCYVWFKDVEGFPGYKVGADGTLWTCWKKVSGGHCDIRSVMSDTWRLVRLQWSKSANPAKSRLHRLLRDDSGRQRWVMVHRLVLEAFVGPCPPGMEGCHFPDRDPANNRLSNLKWATRSENQKHRELQGTDRCGVKSPTTKVTMAQVDRMKALFASGLNKNQIAKREGVNWMTVDLFLKRYA